MTRFAPRYPDHLFRLIEQLDDESLSLAEVTRRVGAAAAKEGITRPSVPHVRALLAELRLRRAEEREIRDAALESVVGFLTYTDGPEELLARPLRVAERVDERRRRRAQR